MGSHSSVVTGFSVRNELQKNAFQSGLSDLFANFAGSSVRNHCTFSEDDQMRADFFNDLQNMRTVKNGFAASAQALDQIPDDER